MYVPPMVSRPEEVAAAIAMGAGAVPPHKPVLCVFLSSKGAPALLSEGPRGKLPSFSYPENAAMALAAAERYGRWRTRSRGQALTLDRMAQTTILGGASTAPAQARLTAARTAPARGRDALADVIAAVRSWRQRS
jgi:acyl-CoA synthetase (NDP forming)